MGEAKAKTEAKAQVTTVHFLDSERLALHLALRPKEAQDRQERRRKRRVLKALDILDVKTEALKAEDGSPRKDKEGNVVMQWVVGDDPGADKRRDFELTGESVDYILDKLEGKQPPNIEMTVLEIEDRLLSVREGTYVHPDAETAGSADPG